MLYTVSGTSMSANALIFHTVLQEAYKQCTIMGNPKFTDFYFVTTYKKSPHRIHGVNYLLYEVSNVCFVA